MILSILNLLFGPKTSQKYNAQIYSEEKLRDARISDYANFLEHRLAKRYGHFECGLPHPKILLAKDLYEDALIFRKQGRNTEAHESCLFFLGTYTELPNAEYENRMKEYGEAYARFFRSLPAFPITKSDMKLIDRGHIDALADLHAKSAPMIKTIVTYNESLDREVRRYFDLLKKTA